MIAEPRDRELERALSRKRRALARRRAKRRLEGLFYRCLGRAVSPWLRPRSLSRPTRRILLLLRAQRLGDAVVSLALSAAVRRAFPDAEVWAAGPPGLAPVLSCDRSLTGFHALPHPEWRHPLSALRAWQGLRQMGFDLGLVLGVHFLSCALGRFASRHAVGYDYNHRGLLLDRSRLPHLSCNLSGWEYGVESQPPHITRFWGGLLEEVTGESPEVSWSGLDLSAHREAAERFLSSHLPGTSPLLAFHPFAGGALRSWPVALARRFVALVLRQTTWRVAITGAREDRGAALSLAGPDQPRVAVAAGKLTVGESWLLLDRVGLLVSVDTALIHMAAALATPVVSLFGAGDPLVWGPYGQQHGVLQANQWCQRCKRSRCLHPGLPCMAALDPERVLDRARELMRRR